MKIKVEQAPGPEFLAPELVKAPDLAHKEILLSIFNQLLIEGWFP